MPKVTASGQLSNTPAQQAGEDSRQAMNYLTGLKFTDYTNATSATTAKKEAGQKQVADLTSKYQSQGYTPAQIKLMLTARK